MNKQTRRPYFEGWYFKHQNAGKTVAIIPAIHRDHSGHTTASIQLIWDDGSVNADYLHSPIVKVREGLGLRIGASVFTAEGISLDIDQGGLTATGELRYGALTPPRGDIMGPVRYIPHLECRHGVVSFLHELSGKLVIGGQPFDFDGGCGYIETDGGHSFPENYMWTQCNSFDGEDVCVMASVADIPLARYTIRGTVCCVYYHGKEYRLATYLGAAIIKCTPSELIVSQGRTVLQINRITECPRALNAPTGGAMTRTVHESVACTVRYRLYRAGERVFDLTSSHAGFEYANTRNSRLTAERGKEE